MTRPMADGRSILERARELSKLDGYSAHERSGEVHDAMRELLNLADAVVRFHWDRDLRARPDLVRCIEKIRAPFYTYDGSPTNAPCPDCRGRGLVRAYREPANYSDMLRIDGTEAAARLEKIDKKCERCDGRGRV